VTILLVVGVAVVGLGAFILLLFPDRPGGKIAWQGVEVSSIGAGLPLIVVGIAAIAIAGGGAIGEDDGTGGERAVVAENGENGDSGDQTGSDLACPDLPQARVVEVPQGANALIVAGAAESKTEPFVLHLIDDNQTVGALAARLLQTQLFEIQSFVDADCQPAVVEAVEPGGAPLDALPNYVNVSIPELMGRSYILNIGTGGTDIRVNFQEVVPR
jgi:hypothetical protein